MADIKIDKKTQTGSYLGKVTSYQLGKLMLMKNLLKVYYYASQIVLQVFLYLSFIFQVYMTNLLLHLKSRMTCCIDYHFNKTNFSSLRREKLVLEERRDIVLW